MNILAAAIIAYLIYGACFVAMLVALVVAVRRLLEFRARRGTRPVAVTVPPVDGSHESMPKDKDTEARFWAIAKRTTRIEVER